MRLPDELDKKVARLRQALIEGERSGEPVPYSIGDVLRQARKEAGLNSDDA